ARRAGVRRAGGVSPRWETLAKVTGSVRSRLAGLLDIRGVRRHRPGRRDRVPQRGGERLGEPRARGRTRGGRLGAALVDPRRRRRAQEKEEVGWAESSRPTRGIAYERVGLEDSAHPTRPALPGAAH